MRLNLGELLLAQRTRTVTIEFQPSWQTPYQGLCPWTPLVTPPPDPLIGSRSALAMCSPTFKLLPPPLIVRRSVCSCNRKKQSQPNIKKYWLNELPISYKKEDRGTLQYDIQQSCVTTEHVTWRVEYLSRKTKKENKKFVNHTYCHQMAEKTSVNWHILMYWVHSCWDMARFF